MPEEGRFTGFLLGFLVVEPTARNDGFISGVMVTDSRGYPLEFKATTPIRPSLVQKTLYGATLEKYVGVELCGKSLIRQLSRRPVVILVPDRSLLDISPGEISVLAIWRAGGKLTVGDDASETHGTINPQQGTFQPLVYDARFHDPSHQDETIKFVEDCATRFDLLEAFERMREALRLLPKEDSRYA